MAIRIFFPVDDDDVDGDGDGDDDDVAAAASIAILHCCVFQYTQYRFVLVRWTQISYYTHVCVCVRSVLIQLIWTSLHNYCVDVWMSMGAETLSFM